MARSRRDDDDYYDRPAPSGGGGKTAITIIGIIGGVILLVAAVCGGLGYYMVVSMKKAVSQMTSEMEKQKQAEANSDRGKAKKFVEQFMQEVIGNRPDAAYKMTTADYQERVTSKQFTAFIKKYAAYLKQPSFLSEDYTTSNTGSTFTFTEVLSAQGEGIKNLSITVVKNGEGWKVDQFTIDNNDGTGK